MHRSHFPLIALVLLIVIATASPISGEAQEATPAATPAMEPQPPTQPTTGPGGSETRFGGMTTIEELPPGSEVFANYLLFVPTDPLPGTTGTGEPFPVVIFIHGAGVVDASVYLAWIEHLVLRGAVVLYPLYGNSGYSEPEYGLAVREDVRAGLETLARDGVSVDVTRVAVVGHSLGGMLAVDYAASAAAAGLPVPTAVMGVVPGCAGAELACLVADPGAIPAATRVLLVTEVDDPDPVERIWAGLEGVPRANRDVVQLVTDAHGKPSLLATHRQALADHDREPPDAFDWYGTWKWLDALMGCAFEGEWCEYALGNTPEQRFMGTWSDGVPVTEAIVLDDPTQASLTRIG